MRKKFKIELLQYRKARKVSSTPLFAATKYSRLKPRLIKNKLLSKKINLD